MIGCRGKQGFKQNYTGLLEKILFYKNYYQICDNFVSVTYSDVLLALLYYCITITFRID